VTEGVVVQASRADQEDRILSWKVVIGQNVSKVEGTWTVHLAQKDINKKPPSAVVFGVDNRSAMFSLGVVSKARPSHNTPYTRHGGGNPHSLSQPTTLTVAHPRTN
jgi:hypothetical protein